MAKKLTMRSDSPLVSALVKVGIFVVAGGLALGFMHAVLAICSVFGIGQ